MKTTNVALIFLGLKLKEIGIVLLKGLGLVAGFLAILVAAHFIMINPYTWVVFIGYFTVHVILGLFAFIILCCIYVVLTDWIKSNIREAKRISKMRTEDNINDIKHRTEYRV